MHVPFHGSSPYSFSEKDLNAKTRQIIKIRSRLSIDGEFQLYFSRCIHDLSFMALALTVFEKMTQTQNSTKFAKSRNRDE